MRAYLLSVISFVSVFCAGLCEEECQMSVLAQRRTINVPKGDSLSLSCVVQHCGHNWTGDWKWGNSTNEGGKTVKESQRHHLTNKAISANQTQLSLNIQSITQSDEGSYGCMVFWAKGVSEKGHLTHVNITTAVPSTRNLLHRVLICANAFLCLPIILGLARCLRLQAKRQPPHRPQVIYEVAYTNQSNDSAPQPPPRCPVPQKRKTSPRKGPPKASQKPDVVYAAISQDALKQQGTTRKPDQSATIYSSLRFNDCTVEMN
ncbi:uncharacterized protein LOC115791097 [Archocentrus centrarchus]|uniref:uncharacterized protein LOC115791097 n=1 Tax=Archocentrus centrarchus TaxID=63155 RepID=UPI0011EA5009|nr:uncharacterized protein LOC115791097 [Archocentrus centrarchus]